MITFVPINEVELEKVRIDGKLVGHICMNADGRDKFWYKPKHWDGAHEVFASISAAKLSILR